MAARCLPVPVPPTSDVASRQLLDQGLVDWRGGEVEGQLGRWQPGGRVLDERAVLSALPASMISARRLSPFRRRRRASSFNAVIIASTSTGLPQASALVGHRPRASGWSPAVRLALPGEDVEHDVGAAGAVERLGTGRLDRLQPVLLNAPQQDRTVVAAQRMPCKGAPFAHQASAVARPAADCSVDGRDDPIGHATAARRHGRRRCSGCCRRHQTVLDTARWPVERDRPSRRAAPPRTPATPSCSRSSDALLGVLDTPIHQPLVDLDVGAAPRDGHEQAAAPTPSRHPE